MKKNIALLTMFLTAALFALAGEGDYTVAKIAPELLKKANVVLRIEDIRFELINTGEAVQRNKYALTILNENGDRHAGLVEYYDKLQSISSIEGTLYDAEGKVLRRLKNKDIQDMSGVDGSSLMDDSRVKSHHFYYKIYPYTVEYEVVTKYNYTLFFPVWQPQGYENLSVEKSRITMVVPEKYELRFKAFNYKSEPVISSEKNKKVMTWEAQNMPAIQKEFASPQWRHLTTMVYFGPTEFEVQGYKGNMNSWQDFGKFVYSLTQGRDVLPDNIKQIVHQLSDGLTDRRQKIEVLYNFLQSNTRYISIQLGIGGWQPFDAGYVAAKRYGDCKALSNYMYSLLKEVGIKSYYTVIKAGENAGELITDFPSSQFNHVILCVPDNKDTVWLECTSQTKSAGYMGDFTGDRYALIVDENGGRLVHTPVYNMKQNLQSRNIKASLDESGTLTIHASSKYMARQQDDLHGLINNLSKDKVKEMLQEQLDFATYDISSFDYKQAKSTLPVIDEKLDLVVSNYATITGRRLFVAPNIMTRSYNKPATDEERKFDIELRYEYKDVDTVEISIPAGYQPEVIPAEVSVNTKFGKYNASVKLQDDKLYYYRSLEQYSGKFPAKDYDELVKYYETIYKADRNKVVLVKK